MIPRYFRLALGLAFWKGDNSSQSMIIGAIIGQFATVVGYYFGSSESSQKKDATIAGALPQQPEPPPPVMTPARRAP